MKQIEQKLQESQNYALSLESCKTFLLLVLGFWWWCFLFFFFFTCTSEASVSYVSFRQCQFCLPSVKATPGRLYAQCLAISVSTVWARAGSVIDKYWSSKGWGMISYRESTAATHISINLGPVRKYTCCAVVFSSYQPVGSKIKTVARHPFCGFALQTANE